MVTWAEEGIEYEAGQRHAELIIRELEMESARSMSTPGTIDRQPEDDDEKELTGKEATKYRRLVARLNYIAQDRPDIQYAVKKLATSMSKPTNRNWQELKNNK